MSNQFPKLCTLLLMGLPLLLLTGCGGSGGSQSSTGTISVSVTDADVLYDEVVLYITELGAALADSDDGDGEAVYYDASTIDWLPVSVNVLDYSEQQTFHLADIEVPDLPEDGTPVCFSQIRFVLGENPDGCADDTACNNYVSLDDGSFYPLETPSGTTSGVKVLAPSDFCVSTGQSAVEVVLDIDPKTAILAKPEQGWFKLKPTQIRIIEGEWLAEDPAGSFVQGTIAVPITTHSATLGCEALSDDIVFPTVTIGAFEQGTTIDPVAQTLSIAEGSYDPLSEESRLPFTPSALCTDRCTTADDPVACEAACLAALDPDSCFYAGSFKLLLPDDGEYDLGASWSSLSATVPYDATVFDEGLFISLD